MEESYRFFIRWWKALKEEMNGMEFKSDISHQLFDCIYIWKPSI